VFLVRFNRGERAKEHRDPKPANLGRKQRRGSPIKGRRRQYTRGRSDMRGPFLRTRKTQFLSKKERLTSSLGGPDSTKRAL